MLEGIPNLRILNGVATFQTFYLHRGGVSHAVDVEGLPAAAFRTSLTNKERTKQV